MRKPITTEVISRVIHLQPRPKDAPGATGTAFFIDVDNREYLVTAKHVVPEFKTGDTVGIGRAEGWAYVQPRLVGHAPGEIDISVLALDQRIVSREYRVEPTVNGIYISQDVYFLGFPYGSDGGYGGINHGYKPPFVKLSILSASQQGDGTLQALYLDGINNPGFSGGPAVFFDTTANHYKVAGVISGYRVDEQRVHHGQEEYEHYIRANSGIIIAYGIEYAVRLARADGNGPL